MNGVLEFIDTSDFTTMNSGEHFMATDIEWDPTGRYVLIIHFQNPNFNVRPTRLCKNTVLFDVEFS